VVVVLAFILSLVVGLAGFLQAKINPPQAWKYLALMPVLWVVGEWTRGWLLSGFPWLYVGYSQTDSWLIGWAPLTGVLGVSLAVCVVAGAIAQFSHNNRRGWFAATLVVTLVCVVGYATRQIDWSSEKLTPIDIAVIQGDVSVSEKWDRQNALRMLDFFVTLSKAQTAADLVIWPEIALPYLDTRLEKIQLWRTLEKHSADFLVGVFEEKTEAGLTHYYNSAFGISADGVQKYRKSRLVPFGEYTPFEQWLGWLDEMVILPASDLSAYPAEQQPLKLAGHTAGVSICYEDAFPADVRKMLPAASYLVNLSEDAWFGQRLAPHQRLQMSRMRAIETARPVIRAANRGISVAIDHRGRIINKLAQNEGKLLQTKIVPTTGVTPFVRFGFVPILIICATLFALALRQRKRRSA